MMKGIVWLQQVPLQTYKHNSNSHTHTHEFTWWRQQMEIFPASLAIFVIWQIPAQRLVTRSLGVFFDLRLNKRLNKQSQGWWFETLSCPLWRHCNVTLMFGVSQLSGYPSSMCYCLASDFRSFVTDNCVGRVQCNKKWNPDLTWNISVFLVVTVINVVSYFRTCPNSFFASWSYLPRHSCGLL